MAWRIHARCIDRIAAKRRGILSSSLIQEEKTILTWESDVFRSLEALVASSSAN